MGRRDRRLRPPDHRVADGVGRHHVQDDRVADVALPPRGKGRGKKAAMTQITQPPLPGVRRAADRADLRPGSLPRSGASQRTAAGQPWCACRRSWQDEERAGRQDARRSRDHGDRIRGLGVFLIPYPLGKPPRLTRRDGSARVRQYGIGGVAAPSERARARGTRSRRRWRGRRRDRASTSLRSRE